MSQYKDGNGDVTRPPSLNDLLLICRQLNEVQAKYIVIGGIAMLEHGLARMTEDIDLLVDASCENVARIKRALSFLPDRASEELLDSDVADYIVVRINDEITIDLMAIAGGVNYAEAVGMVAVREIEGIAIPFATPQLLWKTKQSPREKDRLDRTYLRKWFLDQAERDGESVDG
jgi:hypothetical protein